MAFEHSSGLPATYDRSATYPKAARVIFPEGVFVQGANLNEMAAIEARRNKRIARMTAQDGNRVEGSDIVVDNTAHTASLAAGRVYIDGDVRSVPAAVLTGVSATGEVKVGIKRRKTVVTYVDDPALLGLAPGTWAEGEPGAAREDEECTWALPGDGQSGDFFQVYLIKDGTVIDQTPPAQLTGILSMIALYDREANGHYIVDGCAVQALGKISTEQIFSIGAGSANIQGWKRIREYALRFAYAEDPDLETISAEPSTFTGTTGGSTVVTVLRPPIAAIASAIVVKRITETVTRGPVPGGSDALAHSSVVAIETVTQGATTYVVSTSYVLSGGQVSWAPGGAEPAAASTYSVTYLYYDAVTPTSVTDTTLTVSGGVNGQAVLVSYTSKLPRVDLMCLDISGLPVYVPGLSARQGAQAPQTPATLLKLAEVYNTWLGAPIIVNNGTHNYTYDRMRRYFDRLVDILEQFDRSELERDILTREPVSKKGIFTDNFQDDFYRDQGAAQTAATNRGVLKLAVDGALVQATNNALVTLDFTEEIVIRQDLATSGILINPYANFTQMPADMTLAPATDFWTEQVTTWTSPETREFQTAPGVPPGQTDINEVVSETQELSEFMRQIAVQVTISGFGVGENLSTLTFDGVNVKPGGTQTANGSGVIVVSITVPALMPVGTRRIRAEGAAGSFAEALYVAAGTIEVDVMRRVTLVTRAAPPPTVINVTNVTQVINRIVSTPVSTVRSPEGGGGPSGNNANDPLAQTFTLPEARAIVGVNFKFTAKGSGSKGVRVQLVTVLNGYPTTEVLAEAFVNMNAVTVGTLVQARFKAPVFLTADREFAFVFMTDDNSHALAIARLGDVDQTTQQFVSSQAYTVGVLLASANRLTWTPLQDADLYMQIVAAKYSPTTKTVNLWTGAVTNISDFQVRGTMDIPTQDAQCRFEIVRAGGAIIQLAPEQTAELTEFVTETITLRAVLDGTAKVAPILYPGVFLLGGRIRTTGTYITRQFPMGTAVRVSALMAAWQPAGSTIAVDVDAANDTWVAAVSDGSSALGGGWTEPKFKKDPYTATNGRVRVTLTGGPAARVSVARLRAYSL